MESSSFALLTAITQAYNDPDSQCPDHGKLACFVFTWCYLEYKYILMTSYLLCKCRAYLHTGSQLATSYSLCSEHTVDIGPKTWVEAFDQIVFVGTWGRLVCQQPLYKTKICKRSWKDHSLPYSLSSFSEWGLISWSALPCLGHEPISTAPWNRSLCLAQCARSKRRQRKGQRGWVKTVNDGETNGRGHGEKRGRKWDQPRGTDQMRQK